MPVAYYTDEDTEKLKQMFYDYYTYAQIGGALNRSEGSVTQKVRVLGLKRDMRMVNLAVRLGRPVLRLGNSPEEIRAGLIRMRQTEKAEAKQRQQKALDALQYAIQSGSARNDAIKAAYAEGATQPQIAKTVGMTKQGVSLIVSPPKRKLYDPYLR